MKPRAPYRNIANVVGFELHQSAMESRLLDALQPYRDIPEVQAEIKALRSVRYTVPVVDRVA